MIAVYDNFFTNNVFNAVYDRAKKINLHTAEEHIKKYVGSSFLSQTNENTNIGYWPGNRSFKLEEEDSLLNSVFCDMLFSRHIFDRPVKLLYSYIHLRLDDTNKDDYIHTDPNNFSVIVYISPTNLSSGTKFFFNKNEKNLDNEMLFVKFVQNRAVVFHGDIAHTAFNNHGSCIDDGRLTINGFFNYC